MKLAQPHTPKFWHSSGFGDIKCVNATIRKKCPKCNILKDQYNIWGNIHKFWVNGHICGRVIAFGRRNLSPLWGYYCFRLDFEHFVKSTEKSGRGQTPTPSIGQCQYFASAWPSYPSLSLFLTGPSEKDANWPFQTRQMDLVTNQLSLGCECGCE